MSNLPVTRCISCAAPQPTNPNAFLDGVAVLDDSTGAWMVRRLGHHGLGAQEWLVDDVADLAPESERVESDGVQILLNADMVDDDWRTVCEEAALAIEEARHQLALTMAAAELVACCAVDAGVPEAETARRIGVDRMTVRKWLGKL